MSRWDRTLFCTIRFHRACSGRWWTRDIPTTGPCTCRCHLED